MSTKAIIDQMFDELTAKIAAAKLARAMGHTTALREGLDACEALGERITEARRTSAEPKASRTVALATQVIDVLDSEPEHMHAVLIRQLCNTGIAAEGEVFAVEHGTAALSPKAALAIARYADDSRKEQTAERKAIELLGLIKTLPDSHQQKVCVTVAANLARRLRFVVCGDGDTVTRDDQEVARG